jgi:hypothetical protein
VRASPLLVLVALAAPPARGAEGEWDLRAEMGAGLDGNPDRIAGAGASPQGFAAALASARGVLEGETYRLAARLSGGARLYPNRPEATAGAGRLEAEARRRLEGPLAAEAELGASDLSEWGHRLDQQSLRGGAGLRWDPGGWSASLGGGWTLFAPGAPELRGFRASGPEAWLRGSWAPARRHLLAASAGVWRAGYPGWPEVAQAIRRDDTWTASADYAWRGPLVAGLGYAWSTNRSTAPGGAYERHRVTARGAAFLPRDLALAIRASLQWSRYPEPLHLTEQLLLAQGGESQNAVEARLTVPLAGSLELALALAHYWSEAVSGGTAPAFSRSVTSIAIGWRTGSPDG